MARRRQTRDPGEPLGAGVTMRDIAELAQVSTKSVSMVVNGLPGVGSETRARIETLIAEHGYVARAQAQGLATGRAFLVGHVFNNPNPEYLITLQQGLLDGLEGTGYALVSFPLERSDPRFVERLREFVHRHRLDGIVLTSSVSEDERLRPLLDELQVPYVRVTPAQVDDPERSVAGADRPAAALVAAHLRELGHERIAVVAGPSSFLSGRERLAGFEEALDRAGAPLDRALLVEGDYTFDSGRTAGRALLALPQRPTAVFCANDEMAAGVLREAQCAGLEVPQDLTVVGFDDFAIATRVLPRLTTVRIPTREAGRIAVRRLLSLDAVPGAQDDGGRYPQPELIVRESSGPPPRD
jgi:LacI family transcriptional regulator